MATKPQRLSEQDLAQLYLQTEAPLRLDDLLQGKAEGADAQIAVHDVIAHQTPDLALVSLSLCGLILARDFPMDIKDGHAGPVLRELIVGCEDNLITVGRLWIDSVCHNITPDPKADGEVIRSIPDRLRILASIYMELRDVMEGHTEANIRAALKTLYYQSESHADLADKFVDQMTAKKPKARAAAPVPAKTRQTPDQIPLPFDLVRPRQGAEIVAFSLFREKKPAKIT